MRVLKYLVPLVVIAIIASQSYAGQQLTLIPNDSLNLGIMKGVVWETATPDSYIIDSLGSFSTCPGDSMIGYLCRVFYGTGRGQVRYIWRHDDPTTTTIANLCSIFIEPPWTTIPAKGDSFEVYWGYQLGVGEVRFPVAEEEYSGFEITRQGATRDTIFSNPIYYDEGLFGNGYKFTYWCKADTHALIKADPCSIDVKVILEVTRRNADNWVIPTGYTSIYSNIADDTTWNCKEVQLPIGTEEFRIGVVANLIHSMAIRGQVWWRQFISIPGK